jgi:hypothetical protein
VHRFDAEITKITNVRFRYAGENARLDRRGSGAFWRGCRSVSSPTDGLRHELSLPGAAKMLGLKKRSRVVTATLLRQKKSRITA